MALRLSKPVALTVALLGATLALLAMASPQETAGKDDLNGCDPEIGPLRTDAKRRNYVDIGVNRSPSTNGLIELVMDVGANAAVNLVDRNGQFEGVSMKDIDVPKNVEVKVDFVWDSAAHAGAGGIDATITWEALDPPADPETCADCLATTTETRTWEDLSVQGAMYDPYGALTISDPVFVAHPNPAGNKKAMRFSIEYRGLTMGIVLKDQ